MRIASLRIWVVISAFSSLMGCAQRFDQVILLPQPGGQKSAVVVAADNGPPRTLDEPFLVARRKSEGGMPFLDVFQGDRQAILEELAPLMRIAPLPPIKSILYFQKGGVALMPASLEELERAVVQANARKGAEFFVVGHTDTAGAMLANDALSLQRAKSVAALLTSKGIQAHRIEAIGRGEREPLVPTADEVDEPRNRRVELIVY
jgi:outer membrane protein OmpA-like peptidoglycan-associated protein